MAAACRQGVVILPVIGNPSGEHTVHSSLLATCVMVANQSSTVSLLRKAFAAVSWSRALSVVLDSKQVF